MKSIVRPIALLIAISMLAQPVLAVEVALFKIPSGKQLEIEGEKFRVFTFAEWKQVLIVDQELKSKTSILKEFANIRKELESENTGLNKKIESYQRDMITLKTENDRLTTQWTECDKQLQKCKSRGLFGHVSLLVGGLLAIAGGVAILAK